MNFPDLLSSEGVNLEFVSRKSEKLKKLSGFQNDRHFLPKYFSKSLISFVRNISVKEIEEVMAPVAEKLRDNLELRLGEYTYDVDSTDGGVFECSQFRISMDYYPDENNLNEVFLNINLSVPKSFAEIAGDIDHMIPCQFQYVKFTLSPAFQLRGFIEQYEEFFSGGENHINSYYDLNATEFELNFLKTGKKIILTDNEIKVYFSSQFSVSDFLNDYIKVNSIQ